MWPRWERPSHISSSSNSSSSTSQHQIQALGPISQSQMTGQFLDLMQAFVTEMTFCSTLNHLITEHKSAHKLSRIHRLISWSMDHWICQCHSVDYCTGCGCTPDAVNCSVVQDVSIFVLDFSATFNALCKQTHFCDPHLASQDTIRVYVTLWTPWSNCYRTTDTIFVLRPRQVQCRSIFALLFFFIQLLTGYNGCLLSFLSGFEVSVFRTAPIFFNLHI